MDQTELLWACLNACHVEDVKNLHPECIDWSRHSKYGSTFMVQCVGLLVQRLKKNPEQILDCMKLFISWGASPWQRCSQSAKPVHFIHRSAPELIIEIAGLSAISFVEELIEQFNGNPELREKTVVLRRALSCFFNAIPKEKAARISIHEAVVELWEKQLAAKASHDLTFKTADGEVTAHAQMLKDASSVISAMLASTMKEGQARTIEVKDTNSSSVLLFLERLVSSRL